MGSLKHHRSSQVRGLTLPTVSLVCYYFYEVARIYYLIWQIRGKISGFDTSRELYLICIQCIMQWLVWWFGCRCLQLTKYTFMSSFNMLKKKLHHAVDTKIFLKRQTTFFHYSISLLFKTYFKMNLIQFQKLYGKEHICIVALEKFHRGDSSRLWFLVELIIFINIMYISKDLIHNNWIWHNWKTFSNLLLS